MGDGGLRGLENPSPENNVSIKLSEQVLTNELVDTFVSFAGSASLYELIELLSKQQITNTKQSKANWIYIVIVDNDVHTLRISADGFRLGVFACKSKFVHCKKWPLNGNNSSADEATVNWVNTLAHRQAAGKLSPGEGLNERGESVH